MEEGRRKRIASVEWDSHKANILRLYVTENQALSKVMETLAREHAFYAR
jgi:hypothetical protein